MMRFLPAVKFEEETGVERLRRADAMRADLLGSGALVPTDPERYERVRKLALSVLREAVSKPDVNGGMAAPDIGEEYSALNVHPEEMRAVLIEEITRKMRGCRDFFDLCDLLLSVHSGADFIKLFEGGEA